MSPLLGDPIWHVSSRSGNGRLACKLLYPSLIYFTLSAPASFSEHKSWVIAANLGFSPHLLRLITSCRFSYRKFTSQGHPLQSIFSRSFSLLVTVQFCPTFCVIIPHPSESSLHSYHPFSVPIKSAHHRSSKHMTNDQLPLKYLSSVHDRTHRRRPALQLFR